MIAKFKTLTPIQRVQNVGLGAVLLATFGRSYQDETDGKQCGFYTYFLVLPLLFSGKTRHLIKSTYPSSGLSKFVSKLGERREDLLAVNQRVIAMRETSFKSIATGVSAGLLTVNYGHAVIRANHLEGYKVPERLKLEFHGADKLGRWFAKVPPAQAFSLLQVQV